MLMAYALTPAGPQPLSDVTAADEDGRVGWIDLLAPTPEEDKAAERFLGASIPTREEAQEIEFSSRFYTEDGVLFLSVSIIAGVDARKPMLTPLTFAISKSQRLATVRYDDFAAFRQFLARSTKSGSGCNDANGVTLTLIDAIIDRIADVIERTGSEIDRLNREIFGREGRKTGQGKRRERRLESYLGQIGVQNDIVSKTRESLASVERMLQFLSASTIGPPANKGEAGQLKQMSRDVRSLTDHLSFLSNRATFLLDATLGLISVQQNDVIRIFTVVATILLPPTLIGTIYGMNFIHMPELDWVFGYPLAIGVMVASALVPYFILKGRGWF